jgi:hypothetical protein
MGYSPGGLKMISMGKWITSMALVTLFSGVPTLADSKLEGRINKKRSGNYDVLVRISEKSAANGKSKLLQTIRFARVSVVNGGFDVYMDLGFKSKDLSDLIFDIETRRFESWEAFKPGKVERISESGPLSGEYATN